MSAPGPERGNTNDAMRRLHEQFGDRIGFLSFTLVAFSQTGPPCDVTFYRRNPIINVRVGQQLFLAIAYGARHKRLAKVLNVIKFSDVSTAGITEIWTINPMPKGGFTERQLAAVDLNEAESPVGPNGKRCGRCSATPITALPFKRKTSTCGASSRREPNRCPSPLTVHGQQIARWRRCDASRSQLTTHPRPRPPSSLHVHRSPRPAANPTLLT